MGFRETIVAVEKLIRFTCSKCVPVALVIQRAQRMRHIVIYGLSASVVFFFHFIS
jgi:hypothetical protein